MKPTESLAHSKTGRKRRTDFKGRPKCAWPPCPNRVNKANNETCSFSCRSQLFHYRRGEETTKTEMERISAIRRAKRPARYVAWLKRIVTVPNGKDVISLAEAAKIAFACYTKGMNGHRYHLLKETRS